MYYRNMSKKISDTLFKLLVVIIIAVLGWIIYPFFANLLIMGNLFPETAVEDNFGYVMTQKAILVWGISILLSLGYLFVKNRSRIILLSLPVIAPSLFALLYTLSA